MTDLAFEIHRPGGNPNDCRTKLAQADGRVVEEIEHDPDGDRRGHERQQQQELGEALADEGAVQDERSGDAEHALDRDREERERERPAERVQKARLRQHPRVAVEADERRRACRR